MEVGIGMRVCICDDERYERETIRRLCEQFFEEEERSVVIQEAESADEVLTLLAQTELLILDIEMPGMDGVSLKNCLQREQKSTMILFVTSHDEMMPEAFGMHVIGFVEKRHLETKLPRYLTVACNLLGKDKLLEGKYHSRNVLMIHSEREYCKLFMKDGTTALVRSSIVQMSEKLSEYNFVRVSRGWMVNLGYIEKLSRKLVTVAGTELTVSRSRALEVEKAYDEFCERNARFM